MKIIILILILLAPFAYSNTNKEYIFEGTNKLTIAFYISPGASICLDGSKYIYKGCIKGGFIFNDVLNIGISYRKNNSSIPDVYTITNLQVNLIDYQKGLILEYYFFINNKINFSIEIEGGAGKRSFSKSIPSENVIINDKLYYTFLKPSAKACFNLVKGVKFEFGPCYQFIFPQKDKTIFKINQYYNISIDAELKCGFF